MRYCPQNGTKSEESAEYCGSCAKEEPFVPDTAENSGIRICPDGSVAGHSFAGNCIEQENETVTGKKSRGSFNRKTQGIKPNYMFFAASKFDESFFTGRYSDLLGAEYQEECYEKCAEKVKSIFRFVKNRLLRR